MILSGALCLDIVFHYLAEPNSKRSVKNFPYSVIDSGGEECVTGLFFMMEPMNPVLPGEGRPKEIGVQMDSVQARLDEFV